MDGVASSHRNTVQSYEAWKPHIKASSGVVLLRPLSLAWRWAPSPWASHGLSSVRARVLGTGAYPGECPPYRRASSVRVSVHCTGACPLYGCVSSVQAHVLCMGACPLYRRMSSVRVSILSTGVCPLYEWVSCLQARVLCTGTCPLYWRLSSVQVHVCISFSFLIRTPGLLDCVCSVIQSCLTLCDPMNCSPPGSSVHGIFQAKILEWVAISFSRGPSRPRDRTCVSCPSCLGRWILYHWVFEPVLMTSF